MSIYICIYQRESLRRFSVNHMPLSQSSLTQSCRQIPGNFALGCV